MDEKGEKGERGERGGKGEREEREERGFLHLKLIVALSVGCIIFANHYARDAVG